MVSSLGTPESPATCLNEVFLRSKKSGQAVSVSPRGKALILAFFWVSCLAISLVGWQTLPLVGEETRRGQVAREMIATGDWLVPREQGELYCTRPPLQNWLIAASALIWGKFDHVPVRVPSLLALIVTATMCFAVTQHLLGSVGGVYAGMMFLTMGQTLTIGHLGETDSVFTLFLSGSLLIGFLGCEAQRAASRRVFWLCAGLLAGLAALTKGLQAPVYFVLCSISYLVLTKRIKSLAHGGFVFGLVAMILPIIAWTVPYFAAAGPRATLEIWLGQVGQRMTTRGLLPHLAAFPVEIFGAMLPWSIVVLAYLDRAVQHCVRQYRRLVFYLSLCLGLTMISLWLVPEAKNRYFLPLYPLAAVLFSLPLHTAVEAAQPAREGGKLPVSVRFFLRFVQFVGILAILGCCGLAMMQKLNPGAELFRQVHVPIWGFIAVVLLAVLSCSFAQRALHGPSSLSLALVVLCFGNLVGLGHRLVVLPIQRSLMWSPREQIAALAVRTERPECLVSLGPVPAGFRYHYPYLIEKLPPDTDLRRSNRRVFCLLGTQFRQRPPQLDAGPGILQFRWNEAVIRCPSPRFSWTVLDVIPLGRTPTRDPQPVVVVGELSDPSP